MQLNNPFQIYYNLEILTDIIGQKFKQYNIKLPEGLISIHYYLDHPEIAYLTSLYVNNEFRNKGIGSKLLMEALQENFKEFHLQVEKNSWMYDWYLRKGFIEYYKENDKIWMQLYVTKQ